MWGVRIYKKKYPPLPGETEAERIKRIRRDNHIRRKKEDPLYWSKRNRRIVSTEHGHKAVIIAGANKRHKDKFGYSPGLTVADVQWPAECPVFGTPLYYGSGKGRGAYPEENTPSIDQIDPGAGYSRDNIVIMSWRANNLKRNASAEELRAVADWMDKNRRW